MTLVTVEGSRYLRIATDKGYIRISINEDGKFYIRDTGLIYEDVDFEELLELIKGIL